MVSNINLIFQYQNRLLYNPLTTDYFKNPEKTGEIKEEDLTTLCHEVFDELFVKEIESYTKKIKNKWRSPQEYPLIIQINSLIKIKEYHDIDNLKCDEVFAEYLYKVSKLTNPEYFKRVARFVFLYRENLNIVNIKKYETPDEEEYSTNFNAEDAPDVSNEFIPEFLETEDMLFDYCKEEAIEITQNFCQWMYDSNYTSSKLTLISNQISNIKKLIK